MPPITFASWPTPEAFEEHLRTRPTCWIFKHSTRCDISAAAQTEVEKLASGGARFPIFRVLVVENRPTSLAIAEKLGVPHASPQAILLRDGTPAWTASHWEITAEALAAAEAGEEPGAG